ncbi:MAG: primosomal protein N' (replication factor Y) - superfamily II helicase [Cyanobacteria bacterium J06554_6]
MPSPTVAQYPCPSCGADMAFSPSKGLLACDYCGHTQQLPEANTQLREQTLQEHDFHAFANANQTQIATLSSTAQEVQCPGCRANITFQPPDVADQCPFCGTNIVAQAHAADPTIAPAGLIPFKVGRKQAMTALREWLSFRWDLSDWKAVFLPGQLKQLAQQQGLSGVYLPFWTFDAHTVSDYRGERGTHYYVTRKGSDGKTERVRKTRWRSASGQVNLNFDDVLVAASESIDRQRLCKLWPKVSAADLEPYAQQYLAGFKAQRYQILLKPGFELAKQQMEPDIRSKIRRDIGGDDQRVHQVSTSYSQETFKHILLPVWLMSYRYQGKAFQVMVNAQTGKVLGDRPLSAWKVAVAVAIATVIGVAIIYAAAN